MIDEQVERLERQAYRDGKQDLRDKVLDKLCIVEADITTLLGLVEDLSVELQTETI